MHWVWGWQTPVTNTLSGTDFPLGWILGILTLAFVSLLVAAWGRRWRKKHLALRPVMEQQRKLIESQRLELLSYSQRVEDINENLVVLINERASVLEDQRNKLMERTKMLMEVNQELAERNAQLERYAELNSHPVRRRVARIKGLLDLIFLNHQKELTPGIEEYLGHMIQATLKLDEVIHDIQRGLELPSEETAKKR
ncbi:MAG TPA: hypothetical protein DCR93_21780 [Cytophagales bacterium]|nr:hypothetical protein [Cytophagales bacterium]HAP62014.1 hypothetical protein [Cytophagales bacterium]